MEILATAATEIWKVALGALILGAGLPALFALGMRSMASGQTVAAGANGGEVITSGSMTGAGRLGAIVCFGIVILAVLFGIVVLIWGKQIFGT